MTQTSVVEYFLTDGVEHLKSKVSENIGWYLKNGKPTKLRLPAKKSSNITANLVKLEVEGNASLLENDIQHSILLYRAFKDLTPHQATDGRLWSCLCHTTYRDYVRTRWLSKARESTINRAITNHYFVNGNRGLRRDNGVARLWWLGHIAHQVDSSDPKHVLQLINRTADIRLNLIDRPSISSNVRVLRAICMTMHHFSDEDKLFTRENFRGWMLALNQCGGVLVLDTLSDSDLEALTANEALNVLTEN